MARLIVKNMLKTLLRRTSYRIVRSPPGHVRGLDWLDDLRAFIPHEGALCLDVGANDGQTIRALQGTLRNPRIHSFEPASATYESLASRDWGTHVKLHNLALGASRGSRLLQNHKDSRLDSFLELTDHPSSRFRDLSAVSEETVALETLDNFVTTRRIEGVDLLKIDTQGFDLRVLQGASDSVSQGLIGAVFVELNFAALYVGQSDPSEVDKWLRDRGFALVDLYEKVRERHAIEWCSGLYIRR